MNAHTKQQQDNVFETDFIDSTPFAHLMALSHIYIYIRYSPVLHPYGLLSNNIAD